MKLRLLVTLGCWLPVWSALAAQPGFEAAADVALSHQSIYAILQDSEGFLWFGTEAGLDRYDGYDVVRYRHSPSDPATLSSNPVSALLEDSAGALWVGTQLGLNRISQSRAEVRRVPLGTPEGEQPRVNTLLQDGLGRLWVGTQKGLYFGDLSRGFERVADQPGVRVVGLQSLPAGRIGAVYWDSAWPESVAVIDAASATIERSLEPQDFLAEARSQDPSLARRMETPLASQVVLPRPEPSYTLAPVLVAEGETWIGFQDGLLRIGERDVQRVRMKSDSPYLANFVRALHRDRAGTLWVGTHGGLFRRDPSKKPFRVLAHDDADSSSLSLNAVSSIAQSRDGAFLIGTFGGGLNRWDRKKGRLTRYRSDPSDPFSVCDNIIWAIAPTAGGDVWLGTPGGLCRFMPSAQRFARSAWPEQLGPPPNIRAIALDPADRLVLATVSGLFRFDPVDGSVVRLSAPVHENGDVAAVESLYLEPSGRIWFGTASSRLCRLTPDPDAPGGFREDNWPLPRHGEGIWDLHSNGGPGLWLGSGLGLSVFNKEEESFRHYGPDAGLPGSVVYSITEDDLGRLWLGTNQGLACFDPDATQEDRFQAYPLATGVARTEFNRRAAWRTASGELLLGSMDGLLVFDPAEVRADVQAPPVAITRILVANRETQRRVAVPADGPLVLSYDDYSLSFEFAALDFTSPLKNRYSYQLEGFDPHPSDPGPRRFIQYTNLPPGDYTFRVRGSNEDGVWSEAGASVQLTVRPPFWATWWFRVAAVMLVLGVVAAAYRYRVAKLLEMERLRVQVAGDLHDDLGSSLSGIALLSERLEGRQTFGEQERRSLGLITSGAQRMVEDLRDIVWLVDPSHDQLQDLAERMRDFLKVLEGRVEVSFKAVNLAPAARLSPNTRRQVFLVFKEALHNVVRHASASQANVELSCRGDRLILRVEDNGVGLSAAGQGRGHGLRSMRRRAAAIGARLEIGSGSEGGTEVVLQTSIA